MISIIIIVKNDLGIDSTLKAISSIKHKETLETIVVDASEKEMLIDIKNKYPFVKWIYYKSKLKKVTIPEQRNIGIKSSSGNIVVFIDASCVPCPDWLPLITEPIAQGIEQVVAGSVISEGKPTIHDQVAIRNRNREYLDECPTINLALSREIFSNVGMFNEDMEYGEDIGFSWKLVESGLKIKYVPKAEVSHDWGDWRKELKRSYHYGRARVRLYQRFNNKLKSIFKSDPIAVAYPLFWIGLPMTFFFPFYPLLLLIPLIKNRKDKPITVLIDHLVYGIGILRELSKLL